MFWKSGNTRYIIAIPIYKFVIKFPKYPFLKGILRNVGEFSFWRKRKYPFLLKTYFSFFGFFNIQEFCPPLLDTVEVWYTFNKVGTNQEIAVLKKCSHYFSNNKKFFWDGENLKVGDYGSMEIQQILLSLVMMAETKKYENIFIKSKKRIWGSIISGIPEK